MVEKIEDLYLPTAVVTRLIKEVLPSNATISKEARIAISRAASVFAIYLTSTTIAMKSKSKHKTITAENILEVLKQIEFENFIDPLKEQLEKYRKTMKDKKDAKAENKAKKDQTNNETIESAMATATTIEGEQEDEDENDE